MPGTHRSCLTCRFARNSSLASHSSLCLAFAAQSIPAFLLSRLSHNRLIVLLPFVLHPQALLAFALDPRAMLSFSFGLRFHVYPAHRLRARLTFFRSLGWPSLCQPISVAWLSAWLFSLYQTTFFPVVIYCRSVDIFSTVIAEHLSVEEIADIKEMFENMDINKKGQINFDELKYGLHKLGHQVADSDVKALLEADSASVVTPDVIVKSPGDVVYGK
ncbi:hypothetical protein ZIOFF_052003 [Zingiber officinale]|uniref:EF-hand domain-containing protein n=1 Tax=Zingiber officinale TaxID=94328 RepID=A0A8J5FMT6_ZINOF|nr:hypothetical protein ZIOFF_052003 [Zingiber officinale]